MNELLLKRIHRRLADLPDAQGYQVLDYIEFLQTKYSMGDRRSTPVERLSDAVEDTMRAVRLPGVAIRGTMGAVDSASRLMERLAQAGQAAVDELGKSLRDVEDRGDADGTEQSGQGEREEGSGRPA